MLSKTVMTAVHSVLGQYAKSAQSHHLFLHKQYLEMCYGTKTTAHIRQAHL